MINLYFPFWHQIVAEDLLNFWSFRHLMDPLKGVHKLGMVK